MRPKGMKLEVVMVGGCAPCFPFSSALGGVCVIVLFPLNVKFLLVMVSSHSYFPMMGVECCDLDWIRIMDTRLVVRSVDGSSLFDVPGSKGKW